MNDLFRNCVSVFIAAELWLLGEMLNKIAHAIEALKP